MAGFFLRWFLAFALLAATFNPTGYSYLGWARDNLNAELPMVVLGGLLLLTAIWLITVLAASAGARTAVIVGVLVLLMLGALALRRQSQGTRARARLATSLAVQADSAGKRCLIEMATAKTA